MLFTLSSKRQRTFGLKVLSKTVTARFEIPKFQDLPQQNDDKFETPSQKIHDSLWSVYVYPNGTSEGKEGWVGCFLASLDASPSNRIKADYSIRLSSSITRTTDPGFTYTSSNRFRGFHNMAKRSDVLEKCLNAEGSLIVEVKLRVYRKRTTWYPKPDIETNLITKKLFESDFGADIWFTVGEEKQKFHGHKVVVYHRAPLLYEFLKDVPNGQDFEIPDFTSRIFRPILEYIYLGTLPDLDADNDGMLANELLLAADRFGLRLIKLHVESEIISKFLEPSNAGEWLSFADSYTCPLLKEACMDLYTSNAAEVKTTQGWKAVKESSDLLEEVLDHCLDAGKRVQTKDSKDYDNMSIRMLRENLESLNLDLDGSRKMLVQRLKDQNN